MSEKKDMTAPAATGAGAAAWTKETPSSQDWYWHWTGDPNQAAFPVSVLFSGTAKRFFVAMTSTHSGKAEWCDDYGGYWMKIVQPSTASADVQPAPVAPDQWGMRLGIPALTGSVAPLPDLPVDMDAGEKIALSSIDSPELVSLMGAYARNPTTDTAWAVLRYADTRMHAIMARRFQVIDQQRAKASLTSEALRSLGEQLRNQDDEYTADAMYVIERSRTLTGLDPDYSQGADDVVWCIDDEMIFAGNDQFDALEGTYQADGSVPDNYTRTCYMEQWDLVTVFFSRAAAEAFIERHGHKYGGKLRLMIEGETRNEEWKMLRNWLMTLATQRTESVPQPAGAALGIAQSCGKPLCSDSEHHPLCSLNGPNSAGATP